MSPALPEVDSAPTRRSNRLRAAVATMEVSANADVIEGSSRFAPASPMSRRARRQAGLGSHLTPVFADEPAAVETSAVLEAPAALEAPLSADPVEVAESPADAFTRASNALGFSPVSETEDEGGKAGERVVPDDSPASSAIARRRRIRRSVSAVGTSIGVMGVAGLIAVSMTLPASAVAAVHNGGPDTTASLVAAPTRSAGKADREIQAFVASKGVQEELPQRNDSYTTVSLLDIAAERNIRFSDSLYTNDPNAAIQWPFVVGVAMSSPYGMRNGRLHAGIDLVPGAGATIQAIADGTVRIATEAGGAYGVTAYVDHVIDGKAITSHYAHMQHGSMEVRTGQKVKVGDTIGKVGNTGRSYGAHLHFELIINGSTVDPLPWMRKNAGRDSY